ncbi:MAG: hypothetical protein IKS23_05315 [Alphaproteobacteria bacterium]|nr:hypothetical protein [Alphaproteobacteria bacterium]
MRDMILKAVAQPPKLFWGPVLPTAINAGIQVPMMFMAVGVANVNPLLFVVSIISCHIAIVMAGVKEPHLSTMIQAFGQTNKVSKNLYQERGNKFEP